MKFQLHSYALLLSGLVASSHSANAAEQQANGQAVFDKWCGICHAPGPFHGGTAGLQAKYQGKVPAELEQRTDLSPEAITAFVRHGNRSMPSFRKTEISDAQLSAVVAYLTRNNNVKPAN